VTAETRAREHLLWLRLPRVLTYWTAFGELRFEGPLGSGAGLGLVEHAFGAAIPFDLGRVRTGWQWDVLRIDQGGFAAGLFARGRRALRRAAGRVRSRRGRAPALLSRALVAAECRDADRVAPLRWEGAFRTRAGLLSYEARKATPVAPEVPEGGFLGFESRDDGNPAWGPGSLFPEPGSPSTAADVADGCAVALLARVGRRYGDPCSRRPFPRAYGAHAGRRRATRDGLSSSPSSGRAWPSWTAPW